MNNTISAADRRTGFTLTELLVVIAIVILLVSLLVPSAIKMIEKSREVRCSGNIRQLVTALLMYSADHDNRLPVFGSFSDPNQLWWTTVRPYTGIDSEEVFNKKFRCPSEKDDKVPYTYGANYYFALNYDGQPPRHSGSARISSLPASTFLVGDSVGTTPAIYSMWWWKPNKDADGDGISDGFASIAKPYNQFSLRHNKRGFLGLLDGSVRALTSKEWAKNDGAIWGPDWSDGRH